MAKKVSLAEKNVFTFDGVDKIKTVHDDSETEWIPEDTVPLTSLYVTENGTYTPSDEDAYGFSEVDVSVSSNHNLGSLTATQNGVYSAADSGYDGFDYVNVSVNSQDVTYKGKFTASEPVKFDRDPNYKYWIEVLGSTNYRQGENDWKTGKIPETDNDGTSLFSVRIESEIPFYYRTATIPVKSRQISRYEDEYVDYTAVNSYAGVMSPKFKLPSNTPYGNYKLANEYKMRARINYDAVEHRWANDPPTYEHRSIKTHTQSGYIDEVIKLLPNSFDQFTIKDTTVDGFEYYGYFRFTPINTLSSKTSFIPNDEVKLLEADYVIDVGDHTIPEWIEQEEAYALAHDGYGRTNRWRQCSRICSIVQYPYASVYDPLKNVSNEIRNGHGSMFDYVHNEVLASGIIFFTAYGSSWLDSVGTGSFNTNMPYFNSLEEYMDYMIAQGMATNINPNL